MSSEPKESTFEKRVAAAAERHGVKATVVKPKPGSGTLTFLAKRPK